MGRKVQANFLDQQEKIVKVASRLMSERGYKGTSIQEIANRVGIHKSTFFHYFKNKEELLLFILKVAIREVTENLVFILKSEEIPPEEKLRRAITNHLALISKYIDNVSVYHSEIRFLSEETKRKYLETRKYYSSCFEQIIDEVKEGEQGYFKGLDTKIVTFGILGMCNWVVKWFKASGSYSITEIADIFYWMLTKGKEF